MRPGRALTRVARAVRAGTAQRRRPTRTFNPRVETRRSTDLPLLNTTSWSSFGDAAEAGAAATAGAADPAGPFGSGRLRSHQKVLWFYCLRAGDCQRTLSVRATERTGTDLAVAVTGYDDDGKGKRVAGATVHLDGATAVTGPEGVAHLTAADGAHRIFAEKAGLVRSFTERITVG